MAYITSTYYSTKSEMYLLDNCMIDDAVELFFLAAFSLDYILQFYLAESKLGAPPSTLTSDTEPHARHVPCAAAFVWTFLALADVLTITASITSFAISTPVATSVMYVRVLRLMRIIRVLRALRLFKGAGGEAMLVGGLRHIVLNICSTIVVIWLVSACLLQYVEWVGQAYAHAHAHAHANARAHAHAHAHVYSHVCMHICMLMRMRMRMHMHMLHVM